MVWGSGFRGSRFGVSCLGFGFSKFGVSRFGFLGVRVQGMALRISVSGSGFVGFALGFPVRRFDVRLSHLGYGVSRSGFGVWGF